VKYSKEDISFFIKIALGLLFSLPIILGISTIAFGALKIVWENIQGILSYIIFSIFFLWLLSIIGSFFDKGSNNSKSSSYFRPSNNYPENWQEIRKQALQRDGYRCGNCGATENLHVHHIVPLSKGGSNSLSNLRTLCKNCHQKLHPHMRD
jgi:hypothetical protein